MSHKSQTRKALSLFGLILMGLYCAAQSAAVFTQVPAIAKQGDSAVVITFTVSESTDVEVSIVDTTSGKIINHLAAGVLGGTYPPPEPFTAGLTQSIVWNLKDDDGNPVIGDDHKVRVRIGVKPKFVWKEVTGRTWMASNDLGYHYGDFRDWQPLQLGGGGSYVSVGDITQIPAKYNNGAYVSTMGEMCWGEAPPDSAIMVLLKREADFFVCAHRPKDPFLSRYTETEDSIIACGKSYRIYKAHGQAGDRFYLPNGFDVSDWGIPRCFCFVESDAYVEEALDPWINDPQTDFLCKWHPLLIGVSQPDPNWLYSDHSGDWFYTSQGIAGVKRYNAATGEFMNDLANSESGWGWNNSLFFEGLNSCGKQSSNPAFDVKNQVFYTFGEPAGTPEGMGAVYRFNMADGKISPWPQTGKYWVGGLVPGIMGWAGYAKGLAVGPSGEVYVNSLGAGYDGNRLQVKAVKDGVIIDTCRIFVHASFSTIQVDRKGNIYVGCNINPKGLTMPEDVQSLVNPLPAYMDFGRISRWTGCVLKFPNTGGSLRPTTTGDFDYEFGPGRWDGKNLKATGLTWGYFGFSKIQDATQGSCWCYSENFDIDNWGRLFVPNTFQAEIAVIDNNRNVIRKVKNRDIPETNIIPASMTVTDNYLVVYDALNATTTGFRLDAQSSWFVDIATGVSYNNIENRVNANAASISMWPNPFVSSIGFKYVIPADKNGTVNLGVYDLQGRLIRELVNNSQASGVYNVNWDGRDAKGAAVSNGLYVYRFKTNGRTVVGRIAVLR